MPIAGTSFVTVSTTFPGVTVRLGLVAKPRDPLSSIAWTNLPPNSVQEITIGMGRQHELNRFEAGTATVKFNNEDGRFIPSNTASPYYPHLTPMTWIQIVANWTNVPYAMFTGFITSFPLTWTDPARTALTVSCVDRFKLASMVTLGASPWANEIPPDHPTAWIRLGEGSGLVAADSSSNRHDGQYQSAGGDPANTRGQHSLVAGDADGSYLPVSGAGQRVLVNNKNLITGYPFTVECWAGTAQNRDLEKFLLNASNGALELTQTVEWKVDTTGHLVFTVYDRGYSVTATTANTIDNGVAHHLVARVNSGSSVELFVDGSMVSTSAITTGPPSFPNNLLTGWAIGNTTANVYGDKSWTGGIDEFVFYDGVALTNARIFAHYFAGGGWAGDGAGGRAARLLSNTVGIPLSDIAYDAGITRLGPVVTSGDALSYVASMVETTEGGAQFIDGAGVWQIQDRYHAINNAASLATYGQGSNLAYEAPLNITRDDIDIYNDWQVTRSGGALNEAIDTTSRDTYGHRSQAITTLAASDDDSRDHAYYGLKRYKDPVDRVRELVVHPIGDPTRLFPQVLGRRINDRITVNADLPAGNAVSTFSQVSQIEHVTHTVTQNDWVTTYRLSPSDTTSYWTLGTSTLGVDTVLAW